MTKDGCDPVGFDPTLQRFGKFVKGSIVQQGECLKWSVAAGPPRAGAESVWRIEHVQRRRRSCPENEGVDAATITVFSRARRPSAFDLATIHDAARDRRVDRRTTQLGREQAADRQTDVANQLCLKPHPLLSSQQIIVRIDRLEVFSRFRTLPIDLRRDDQPVQFLQAPPSILKLDG